MGTHYAELRATKLVVEVACTPAVALLALGACVTAGPGARREGEGGGEREDEDEGEDGEKSGHFGRFGCSQVVLAVVRGSKEIRDVRLEVGALRLGMLQRQGRHL